MNAASGSTEQCSHVSSRFWLAVGRTVKASKDRGCSSGYDEVPTFFADLDHLMPADGRLTEIDAPAMMEADQAQSLRNDRCQEREGYPTGGPHLGPRNFGLSCACVSCHSGLGLF